DRMKQRIVATARCLRPAPIQIEGSEWPIGEIGPIAALGVVAIGGEQIGGVAVGGERFGPAKTPIDCGARRKWPCGAIRHRGADRLAELVTTRLAHAVLRTRRAVTGQ